MFCPFLLPNGIGTRVYPALAETASETAPHKEDDTQFAPPYGERERSALRVAAEFNAVRANAPFNVGNSPQPFSLAERNKG